MPYLIAAAFLVGFIGLYLLFYYLNGKTPAPEGCEFPDDFKGCSHCSSTGCVSRIESKATMNHDSK
jgi:hypothetical protein